MVLVSLSAVLALTLSQPATASAGDTVISSQPLTSTFSFRTATPPPSTALARGIALKPITNKVAKKATAAVAGSVIGFFGGILVGAGVGSLGGDDYALAGMCIGAPVGAVVGGVLGAVSAR